MIPLKIFLQKLKIEMPRWISAGIIDESQKDRLLTMYEDEVRVLEEQAAAKRNKSVIGLPAIIMGLAGVLLCIGIIIFYAANWRYMPPAVKLVQVFLLIFIAYGIAYYFLLINKNTILLGRIMLMVGIVSYGAGIALVAQIYHISAHPTNGILAWAAGALAISWVMNEKWGLYLSAALFFVWNTWEFSVYHNPNYLYVVVPILFAYLFYRLRAATGVVLMFFAALLWFFQVNGYWITYGHNENQQLSALALLALCHLPLGLIMIGGGWFIKKIESLSVPGSIMTVCGWVAVSIPFLTLSWPIEFKSMYLVFQQGTIFHSVEFLVLLTGATAMTYALFRNNYDTRLHCGALVFSVLLFVLPQGNTTIMLAIYHVGLFAYIFGFLDFFLADPAYAIERFLAYFIVVVFLAVKGIGLGIMAGTQEGYYIAYGIGFVLYGVVSFLINQAVHTHALKSGHVYDPGVINAACAIAAYIILYAMSFRVGSQRSVLDATPEVLVLVVLFISSALALYVYLWLKSGSRILLVLSGIVFFSSSIMLFISGPGIPWIAYSLLFNIMLFMIIAIFIYYSTRINSQLLLNFAIAGFVLHVVTRYFDIFWDLLPGAFLFIMTGIIGIAGGWLLEKNRRRLIRSMTGPKGGAAQ